MIKIKTEFSMENFVKNQKHKHQNKLNKCIRKNLKSGVKNHSFFIQNRILQYFFHILV